MNLNHTIFQIKLTSGLIFGGIGYLILRLLYLEFALVFLIIGFLLSCLITLGVIFSESHTSKEESDLKNKIWILTCKYTHIYVLAFSIVAGLLFSIGW